MKFSYTVDRVLPADIVTVEFRGVARSYTKRYQPASLFCMHVRLASTGLFNRTINVFCSEPRYRYIQMYMATGGDPRECWLLDSLIMKATTCIYQSNGRRKGNQVEVEAQWWYSIIDRELFLSNIDNPRTKGEMEQSWENLLEHYSS